MTASLSWMSISFYCVFSSFVYYQQLHLKNFQGSSQGFATVLGLSAMAGMITGVAYLGYYGWAVVWWAPIVALLAGLFAAIPVVFAERIIGPIVISLAAFIGWPICAYFMFLYIPV